MYFIVKKLQSYKYKKCGWAEKGRRVNHRNKMFPVIVDERRKKLEVGSSKYFMKINRNTFCYRIQNRFCEKSLLLIHVLIFIVQTILYELDHFDHVFNRNFRCRQRSINWVAKNKLRYLTLVLIRFSGNPFDGGKYIVIKTNMYCLVGSITETRSVFPRHRFRRKRVMYSTVTAN